MLYSKAIANTITMNRNKSSQKGAILLVLLIISCLNLWGQGKAVTLKGVNLRKQASQTADKLITIPKGESLFIAHCNDGWCEVNYKGTQGFVSEPLLLQQPIVDEEAVEEKPTVTQSDEIKYYKNIDGDKIKSPRKVKKAPEGATAICNDGTYSFSKQWW